MKVASLLEQSTELIRLGDERGMSPEAKAECLLAWLSARNRLNRGKKDVQVFERAIEPALADLDKCLLHVLEPETSKRS